MLKRVQEDPEYEPILGALQAELSELLGFGSDLATATAL